MSDQSRYIIIVSDVPLALTTIVKSLEAIQGYTYLTTTRIKDAFQLATSINPKLIITYLRNNTHLDKEITYFQKAQAIPILCLLRKHDPQQFHTLSSPIVFTQYFEESNKSQYLVRNITSILRLVQLVHTTKDTKTSDTKSGLTPARDTNKNLARYTMELDQKITLLTKVKDHIKRIYPQVDESTRRKLMTIVNTIKMAMSDKKHWEDFKVYFEGINPKFLKKLAQHYPDLTAKDLKYCCYLKMNMSNEDICHILGINQESVRTHKYRLKKKMTLPKSQDLRSYIRSFSG